MGFKMESNISVLSSVAGAITGIVEGIDTGAYKTNFITTMMNKVESEFMVESIASRERIKHVFEWGDDSEDISVEPLFKLVRSGRGANRAMTYVFLPSTKPVPLPSSKYGIDAKVMSKLSRHIFVNKAIVMETKEMVHVAPKNAVAILIPTMDSEKGYVMSRQGSNLNPGGAQATGAFHTWWVEWMDTRAQAIAYDLSKKKETSNGAAGRRVIRDAAGRYSKGNKVSFEFARKRASLYMLNGMDE